MKRVRRGSIPPWVGTVAWVLAKMGEQVIRDWFGLDPRD